MTKSTTKMDVLLLALVLKASDSRGQVRLSSQIVSDAQELARDGCVAMIDEKPDGSIVVGIGHKKKQS